jgi:hypothetical protein
VIQTVKDMAVLRNPCRGVELEAEDACAVLEGGPCSPCEERAAISDQIKQLKAKYDTIGTARNAIHDPFIHKLPPEIASHILRLSLPTLKNRKNDPKGAHGQWKFILKEWAVPLKLGSVCRKWRELAWATPDLWTTLYIRIKPSMTLSTAESLPGLLREWLGRSGVLPLTIYFFPDDDCSEFTSEDEYVEEFDDWTDTLDVTAGFVIDLLNLHSGRWRNLHLRASPTMLERFSCPTEPKQLVDLELRVANTMVGDTSSPPKFMMESELSPTHLKFVHFPSTSINIRWDNITHATLSGVTTNEVLDFLRQAPALEYYRALTFDSPMIVQTPVLHPQLRSLHLTTYTLKNLLDAINLPSLEEWTQNTCRETPPLAAMLSFLERSGCLLKLLTLHIVPRQTVDFRSLLQALPSLEHLSLHFRGGFKSSIVMDDIFTRIFRSVPGSSDISVVAPLESFLPNLQFIECSTNSTHAPFSWDRIPQLYLQGHRQLLTLKCAARNSHISDETALRLLQLVDEGFDLQIPEEARDGDFLENFRNRIREEIL